MRRAGPNQGSQRRSGITLTDQARQALIAVARRSAAIERGGLLVGFREGSDILVEDILEVPDTRAGRTTYLRREGPARAALDAYLARPGTDKLVGYVGEWHTHPRPVGPSAVDEAAMRAMVRANRRTVGLIVAALDDDLRTVQLHGLVSAAPTPWTRVAGRWVATSPQTA